MEDDSIDMETALKTTVSMWKMTVSIWHILSLCIEVERCVACGKSLHGMKQSYNVWLQIFGCETES